MDVVLIILLIILSPLIFAFGIALVIAEGLVNLVEAILRCSANVFNGIGNWFTRDRKEK